METPDQAMTHGRGRTGTWRGREGVGPETALFSQVTPAHAGDARHRHRVLSALALLGGPDSCPWSSGPFESLLHLLLPLEDAP